MKKIILPLMILMIIALLSINVHAYPITVRLHSDVGQFHTALYKCTDSDCDSYYFYSHSYGNPTMYVLYGYGTQKFAEFDYKNCYVGQVWNMDVNGKTCNGPHDYDIDFVKQEECHAAIMSLTASDYEAAPGETVTFTALIHSARDFEDNKPLPPANLIVPHYSSHVDAFLYINGEMVEAKAGDIPFSQDKVFTYDYTFTEPGTYEVSIYTKLDNDCKCTDSAWSQKTIIITVTGECTPGDTKQCGDTDQGACEFGTQTCREDGTWGGCLGAVYPTDEVCDGLDNDCDGYTDEGCEEECSPGETISCGETDEGECDYGIETCDSEGVWGECIGAVYPTEEICDNLDNDCDGDIDEGLAIACFGDCDCPEDGYYGEEYRDYYCYTPGTCFSQCWYDGHSYECTPGETRSCGLTDTGACTIGYEECVSGFWSECIGAIYPEEYEICGNKVDDNCNGVVDEDCYDPEIYPREVLSINKLSVFNDCALPGTDFPVLVSFKNTVSYRLKDVRVMGVIDELNDIVRMGPFNLDEGEEEVKLLFFNIPSNAREGEYTLTVIVSNDDVKRIKHRTFRVDKQCPYMAYECCGDI